MMQKKTYVVTFHRTECDVSEDIVTAVGAAIINGSLQFFSSMDTVCAAYAMDCWISFYERGVVSEVSEGEYN